MECDCFLGIQWESEGKMNSFFQSLNEHIKERYSHVFNQPERLNPEDGKAVCDSLNSMET